jgi:hypothetical protein
MSTLTCCFYAKDGKYSNIHIQYVYKKNQHKLRRGRFGMNPWIAAGEQPTGRQGGPLDNYTINIHSAK